MNARRRIQSQGKISRRDLLIGALAGGTLGTAAAFLSTYKRQKEQRTEIFIAKAPSYSVDLASIIEAGLRNLGIRSGEIRGKRILLKPNLIETVSGSVHICTQPEIICGAVQALLRLGAERVIVAEGSGHCRETASVAQETGLAKALKEHATVFIDLNNDEMSIKANVGGLNGLKTLTFPAVVDRVDWIVSMPKMKTHHWAGVTLSMKNMFGLMPGIVYGWPKNVFHCAGIHRSIVDINATVRPHLAIVDGIVGMEGDGPIMGTPKLAGVIVMGRNPAAVDATTARIMGIDPLKVPYMKAASGWLGTISEKNIVQRGENIAAVQTEFQLIDKIPAHKNLRLGKAHSI